MGKKIIPLTDQAAEVCASELGTKWSCFLTTMKEYNKATAKFMDTMATVKRQRVDNIKSFMFYFFLLKTAKTPILDFL